MTTYFIDPSHSDIKNLSGLFFIIDSNLYLDTTTQSIKHNSHKKFFQTILKKYTQVAEKYRLFPYLYFPRGYLLYENDIEKVMLGCPNDLVDNQKQMIITAFNHPIDRTYLYMMDDPHYNLDWLIERIHKVHHWTNEMVEDESFWFQLFFMNQIKQFKGENYGI